MPNEGNEVMKRFLQKIVNSTLKSKDFDDISSTEVFFTFGSQHKSAMCDYVYGIKIYSDMPMSMRSAASTDLIQKINRGVEKFMNKSVCCTDVIWVKNYE